MKIRTSGVIVNVLCAAAAVVLVWEAEVRAYWVGAIPLAPAVIERARQEPASEVLVEISRQRLGPPVLDETAASSQAVAHQADRLLGGDAQFPRQPPVRVAVPFAASNLESGPPTHQLYMAGLGPVDLLLQAYRVSREERFLRAAQEEVAAFARFDASAWIPRGLLWNDHALASGVSILAEYWMLVRSRPDLDAHMAKEVLGLAARTAERLAKPEFFTYRTNHGVMQSMALLQYAVAFPTLENAGRLGRLACSRLIDQFRYYVSPEGAVLEHSAHYHEFGRYLLGVAIELSAPAGCPAPADWHVKLAQARAFSALLRRPDGSLPVFGNTDSADRLARPFDEVPDQPPQAYSLLPVSGYALWWSGLDAWPRSEHLAQTVVLWSNFPTRAHKHGDDMSVLVWANGKAWLRNVGYWPYGADGFDSAHGWRGSNAPHLAGESVRGTPPARLIGAADAGRVRAIELERRTADKRATIRRQVLEIDGSVWVVADTAAAQHPGRLVRLWTSAPRTEWAAAHERQFLLRAAGSQEAARLSLLGELAEKPALHRGELEPFAGWAVHNGMPTPAGSVSVVQDTRGSVVLSVLETGKEGALRAAAAPRLDAGASAQAWRVTLAGKTGAVPVSWTGDVVTAAFPEGAVSVRLTPPGSAAAAAKHDIVSAYADTSGRFTRFRDLVEYRHRATIGLLLLFLLQQAALWGIGRWTGRPTFALHLLGAGAWLVLGYWLAYEYLQ